LDSSPACFFHQQIVASDLEIGFPVHGHVEVHHDVFNVLQHHDLLQNNPFDEVLNYEAGPAIVHIVRATLPRLYRYLRNRILGFPSRC